MGSVRVRKVGWPVVGWCVLLLQSLVRAVLRCVLCWSRSCSSVGAEVTASRAETEGGATPFRRRNHATPAGSDARTAVAPKGEPLPARLTPRGWRLKTGE